VGEAFDSLSLLDLLIGVLIVSAILLKTGFAAYRIPSLVAFFVLAIAMRACDDAFGLVSERGKHIFEFLASIGLIAVLFRAGLESNLHALAEKLASAVPIWLGNVVLSGVPGYLAAHYWLGFGVVPSLFTAVALTATSVAVSVEVWREAGKLNSPDGALLTDVAGLDDVSGVAMLGLLAAVAPVLAAGNGVDLAAATTKAGGVFLAKLLLFGAICLLFARYAERRVTSLLRRADGPDPVLDILGIGIVIAAFAGQLGFSLAIGALMAGLLFSRDPQAVRMESGFVPLYEFFAPFFFIGVGLEVSPAALASASWPALALLAVAILGKVVGTALPALLATGAAGALALGASMVPRAEIAMVVMQEGRSKGLVPDDLFASMALVAIVTCIVAPLAVRRMLRDR
jgi:Kef-type K+ transport system membrane component KefB